MSAAEEMTVEYAGAQWTLTRWEATRDDVTIKVRPSTDDGDTWDLCREVTRLRNEMGSAADKLRDIANDVDAHEGAYQALHDVADLLDGER